MYIKKSRGLEGSKYSNPANTFGLKPSGMSTVSLVYMHVYVYISSICTHIHVQYAAGYVTKYNILYI